MQSSENVGKHEGAKAHAAQVWPILCAAVSEPQGVMAITEDLALPVTAAAPGKLLAEQRSQSKASVNPGDAKMTFAQAAAAVKAQEAGGTKRERRTRDDHAEVHKALVKRWPELEALELRKATPAVCLMWHDGAGAVTTLATKRSEHRRAIALLTENSSGSEWRGIDAPGGIQIPPPHDSMQQLGLSPGGCRQPTPPRQCGTQVEWPSRAAQRREPYRTKVRSRY